MEVSFDHLARAAAAYALPPYGNASLELFYAISGDRDLRHAYRQVVPTEAETVADVQALGECVAASDRFVTSDGIHVTLLHGEDAVSRLQIEDGSVFIHVLASTPARADQTGAQLRDALIAPDPERSTSICRMSFWSAQQGMPPRCMRRDISAQEWHRVSPNYANDVQQSMQGLLGLDRCPDQRLILWHGPPGTGKTHALRSLALAWSEWCSTHYICDPEKMLNDVAGYLLEVACSSERHRSQEPERAKLVVLEDSGELMSTTARAESGQGLSRVLNLTDGILGQGLEVIVLITTNEPLGSLHAAVTRPGRCLAEVEFAALSAEESNAWLKAHGSTERVGADATLADLYALRRGERPRGLQRRPIGFAA